MNIKHKWIAVSTTASILAFNSLPGAAEDEWQFSIAPLYLWAKNVEGSSSAGGKDAPLSLDFRDDILENLDAAYAVHAEASKGNWTFFAEHNFARLDPTTKNTVGGIDFRADVEFEDTLSEAGVAWALADSGAARWELLGGLRYYKQDLTIKFSNSLGIDTPFPDRVKTGDSWMQPFAGVRVTAPLSERWSVRGRADYGYEGSDNTAVQGVFYFSYRFRDWGSAFVGYRYLGIDFDNGSSRLDQYGFDGDHQGPLVGLNLHL